MRIGRSPYDDRRNMPRSQACGGEGSSPKTKCINTSAVAIACRLYLGQLDLRMSRLKSGGFGVTAM